MALGTLLPGALGAQEAGVALADRISFPERRREFRTPGWLLSVEAVDGWKTPRARAQLWTSTTPARLCWSLELAHEYGPRDALIGAEGRVLLLDEWINVNSRRALTLIAADGRVLASHGYADIVTALRTTPAKVAAAARRGPWMGADPSLSADGRQVRIAVAGQQLLIDLEDGRLHPAPP